MLLLHSVQGFCGGPVTAINYSKLITIRAPVGANNQPSVKEVMKLANLVKLVTLANPMIQTNDIGLAM